MNTNMKVIILCAGKGLRYDNNKPKGLAMIGNIPILHHVMNIYAKQGHENFILIIGNKGEQIKEYFKNYTFNIDNCTDNTPNYKLTFVNINKETLTGGAVLLAKPYIPLSDKNFFCTYCDCLGNVNLNKLEVKHITNKNIATITVTKPYSNFGITLLDSNDNIIGFSEKPKLNEYINAGFFIFNTKIFNYITNDNSILETDVFNKLVEKNQLGAYRHDNITSFWETINNMKDEQKLNDIYNEHLKYNNIPKWLDVK